MAQVSMGVDLSTLINALIDGNTDSLIAAAREHLHHGEQVDVLIGRINRMGSRDKDVLARIHRG